MTTPGRGFLPNRGQARLGYIYASPLVRKTDAGRKERMELLETAQELSMIRETLRGAEREIRFRAVVASPSNLRELLNYGCRLLHYTGHGSEDFLAFESDQYRKCGVMEPLKVQRLKALFQAGGVTTQVVFISSCASELSGHAFVEAGVPHVVAVRVQERITDQAAQLFGRAFYHALIIGGYTVKDSFKIGLETVNASSQEGDNFLLLPADGDHEVKIFDMLNEGAFHDDSEPLPPMVRCPKARHLYLGSDALQSVVETLMDPASKCLTLIGEQGIGKTERALQACEYVRQRHRFTAIFFANCGKAASDSSMFSGALVPPYINLCRLKTARWMARTKSCALSIVPPGLPASPHDTRVGLALGMPEPGPSSQEELTRYLFTNPNEPQRSLSGKVLLVLDGVDSLYVGERGEVRDSLVDLLSYLCCFNGQLHLLLTSERSVLRDTTHRLQNGSERVILVQPLRGTDSAQLLVDLMPRPIRRNELELAPVGASHADFLAALKNQPMLQAAEGHPGTLVRLAPLLTDYFLYDEKAEQMAAKFRQEYSQQTRTLPHSRTNSGNSLSSSHSEASDRQRPSTPSTPSAFFSGAVVPSRGDSFMQSSHSGFPSTPPGGNGSLHPFNRRMPSAEVRMRAQNELDPGPPNMTPEETRAWESAVIHGQVRDRGCRLVWVKASAIAASSRGYDGYGSNGRGVAGVPEGLSPQLSRFFSSSREGDRNGGGSGGVFDNVTWDDLLVALQEHLCGSLTIPSSRDRYVDLGPFENLGAGELDLSERGERDNDEGLGGYDLSALSGGFGNGYAVSMAGGYGAIDVPPPRGMSTEDLVFVRGILKSKQSVGQPIGHGRRGSIFIGQGGGDNRTVEDAEVSEDIISVQAFGAFSRWWAPLLKTLSLVRREWAHLDPVMVHGFVSRIEAEKKLRNRERGTFLIRFSESRNGELVVSFTDVVRQAPPATGATSSELPQTLFPRPNMCMQHCLITARHDGCFQLEIGENGNVVYRGLKELVRDCTRLRFLYPNLPKEQVFGDHTSSWGAPAPPLPVTRHSEGPGMGLEEGGGYAWADTAQMASDDSSPE